MSVAFRNGFVNVRAGIVSLVPRCSGHCPDHRYPWDFEPWTPSATPRFGAFLDQLFADCSEIDRVDRIALLQEFVGACLVGDATRWQQCLFLYGPGANGKSTLLALVRAMFPAEALCSIPPRRWSMPFGLADLEDKRVNLVSDVDSEGIQGDEVFKAVIDGDTVTAERKHRAPRVFKPVAGHIFSTNSPCSSRWWSVARRIIVLPLTRRFDESGDRQRAPLGEVISAELPSVIAWAIEGAARAQREGSYTSLTFRRARREEGAS